MLSEVHFENHLSELVLTHGLRLRTLANRLGVSERTVHAFVRTHYRTTPARLIQDRRMETALLYLQGRYYRTVAEVAFSVGFTSAAHFSRVFTRHYGYKPSDVKLNRALRRQSSAR